MSADEPVYIFVHVPKTGGTTIIRHLRRHLLWDEEFVHLGTWGDNYRAAEGRMSFFDRSAEERARTRVLAGHRVRYGMHELTGRDPRYITFLRDPAERIVSAYNFQMKHEAEAVEFAKWYSNYPRNNAFKWLRRAYRLEGPDSLGDLIIRLRNDTWFVGTTEHLNDDLPYLFVRLGTPPVWVDQRAAIEDKDEVAHSQETLFIDPDDGEPRKWLGGSKVYRALSMSDELREQIYETNFRDLKLYKAARKIRRNRLSRLREGIDPAAIEARRAG